MIVGAIAFAVFWVLAPTSVNDVPWAAALAVHGVSIAALLIGLAALALATSGDPRGRPMIAGIAVTTLGLLTAFLLIPIGLAAVAIGILLIRGSRLAAVLLLGGSAGLVAVFAAGARVGIDDAAPLSNGEMVWFQASVALTATGLVALARHRRAHRVASAPAASSLDGPARSEGPTTGPRTTSAAEQDRTTPRARGSAR